MAGHIASAARESWNTPPEIVAAVHAVFDGPPDLDPCSNADSIVGAKRTICRPDDGLTSHWRASTAFVNPPFGKGIGRWVGRCVQEYRDHKTQVLLLIPAAVDTRHWHEHVTTAARVCFLRGRVRFIGAEASAPFATAIAYWGDRTWAFEEVFGPLGVIYQRVKA